MSLENNPFINKPQLKHRAIPFDDIKLEHFIPALDYAISKAEKNLEFIKNNPEQYTSYSIDRRNNEFIPSFTKKIFKKVAKVYS